MYRNYGYGFSSEYFYTMMEPSEPDWPEKLLFYRFTLADDWNNKYLGQSINAYTLSRSGDTNLVRETVDFEL